MGACRAIAVMGVIAGIAAVIAAAAAVAPPVTGGLKDEAASPKNATTQNESAKPPPPPCARVIGAEPVDMSRCRHRVVTGAAKPEPYPVIPALFPAPGKP